MTKRIVQSECRDSKLDAMTQALLQQAIQSVTTHGVFNLVLSDSEALGHLYARLMYDPDLRAMPWNATHLWFLRGVEESIVSHSGIPEENVHSNTVDTPMDCCLISCSDVGAISEELSQHCTAFLVLADTNKSIDWDHSGVAHWFC
jgi:hypothetical protein